MNELKIIFTLLIAPILLAVKSKFNYGGFISKNSGWGKSSYLGLCTLIFYMILILVLGKSEFYKLCQSICIGRFGGENHLIFLILVPSVGFGLILYPYVASDFYTNYVKINLHNMGWYVSLHGWLMIALIALIVFV